MEEDDALDIDISPSGAPNDVLELADLNSPPARWREYMMTAVADRLRPWARVGEEMVTLRTFSRSRRSTSLR
jgi:hypothetical protein